MLRRTVFAYCAAAGAGAGSAPPTPAVGAAAEPGAATEKKVEAPTFSWTPVKPYAWRPVEGSGKNFDGHSYFFGETLGKRPIVVLPGCLLPGSSLLTGAALPADLKTPLDSFLPMKDLPHGALMAPMTLTPPAATGDSQNIFEAQVESVVRMLDYHHVSWGHLVAYANGGLLAMTLARLFPHRVGTITLIDTPVLTDKMISNSEQRAEFALAKKDVNIPEEQLQFHAEMLGEEPRDGPFANPFESNKGFKATSKSESPVSLTSSIYDSIFGAHTYAEGGTVRDLSRYVDRAADLVEVRHPVMAVVPGAKAVMDLPAHMKHLNIRKKLIVKECKSHQELFQGAHADAVGKAVVQFTQRWDLDEIVRKKVENAKKDIAQASSGGGNAAAAAAPEAEDNKKKKKKKNKK